MPQRVSPLKKAYLWAVALQESFMQVCLSSHVMSINAVWPCGSWFWALFIVVAVYLFLLVFTGCACFSGMLGLKSFIKISFDYFFCLEAHFGHKHGWRTKPSEASLEAIVGPIRSRHVGAVRRLASKATGCISWALWVQSKSNRF